MEGIGYKFYDRNKKLNHIVNIFKDGKDEIVVYKYWSKYKKRWYYESNYKNLFLIPFDYGYKWVGKELK